MKKRNRQDIEDMSLHGRTLRVPWTGKVPVPDKIQ